MTELEELEDVKNGENKELLGETSMKIEEENIDLLTHCGNKDKENHENNRSEFVKFRVSVAELELLDKNAERKGLDRSKFCRERTLKEEFTINEMLNFLVMFITQREVVSDVKTWKKWDLKKLNKPFDVKLNSITMAMVPEERERFEAHWQEKMAEAGSIMGELKAMLEGRRV